MKDRVLTTQWVSYELRRIGLKGLVTPALTLAIFACIATLMVIAGADDRDVARVLTAVLEVGLPLSASVVAAAVVVDPMIDLHFTFATRFRTTVFRRLSLLIAWTTLVAILWATALRYAGLWSVPKPFLLGQLGWFAPLVWFVVAGALLAIVFRSRTVSISVLGGLWVFENVFYSFIVAREPLRPFFLFATTYTPDAPYWLGNRLALIAVGVVMAVVLAWVVRNGESLTVGGDV